MKRMISLLIILIIPGFHGHAQKPLFNHAALYVTDIEKSKQFYLEVIGLDSIANPFKDNKHVFFVIGNGLELHLIAGAPSAEKHPQNVHLSFSVPSVEDFIVKLKKANIPFENSRYEKGAITTRPDGVKQIYFTDPDGYWIEINNAGR